MTIAFLLCLTITESALSDWEEFKRDYEKKYESSTEEIKRREIFLDNIKQMKEYQRLNPEATFTMDINHFDGSTY